MFWPDTSKCLVWTPAFVALPVPGQPIWWHGPHGEHVAGELQLVKRHLDSAGLPAGYVNVPRFVTVEGETINYIPSSWRPRDVDSQESVPADS